MHFLMVMEAGSPDAGTGRLACGQPPSPRILVWPSLSVCLVLTSCWYKDTSHIA